MKLKKFLKGRKLEDFAKECGLSKGYISLIANEKRRASMEAAIRIIRTSNNAVTFEDLAGEDLELQTPAVV